MGTTDRDSLETAGVHKVLCLLEALRQSPTGKVIYRQVERMLDEVVDQQRTVEQAYVSIVNQLLDAYMSHLRQGSSLHVQVRLLRARLQPPLTPGDLRTLRDYVDLHAAQIEELQDLDTALFESAVEPLLASFGISEAFEPRREVVNGGTASSVPTALEPEEEQPNDADAEHTQRVTSSEDRPAKPSPVTTSLFDSDWPLRKRRQPDADEQQDAADTLRDVEPAVSPTPTGSAEELTSDAEPEDATETSDAGDAGSVQRGADTRVDSAYRSHLDSKRRDIQKLQATLAQQVLETISQNEEFGVLLEVVLGELRQAGDSAEMEDLRWTLIREIEKLTKGHHDLAENLDRTHHYLQLIESDSRQLSDELTRVRLLSLTDELTGLPNRRAFLRRIEDEVARVQRYGFPLSLALIDLDHFKQINDKYGHAGGDEVLQIYSKNILSIFRHHDLVARYGGEEFAVLLPNTEAEGALRALNKVRNRASETRWQANGSLIPVPSFSAGLSLYKPGETASAFIERADKALYRAKRLGRNRVELDATFGSSDSDGEENRREGVSGEANSRGET